MDSSNPYRRLPMNILLIRRRMLLIGAALGFLFWMLDSKVDSILLKTPFLREAISTEPGELWMRIFFLSSSIGVGYYAGVLISRAERANTEMRKLSTAVERAADMIVITDNKGLIEYVNPAFESITGYTKDEVAGKTPRILKSGVHGEDFYRELWTTILSGNVYRNVFANKKKNGELYYDECTITPIRDHHGVITHFIATAKDITERMLAEQKLRNFAERDALTCLYNRRKFYELLEQEKDRAVRYSRALSLVMFDIDHFKAVNDAYGHAAGDRVLRDTAAVVTDHIRASDIMARVGGEEFAVLAAETAADSALALAEKIRCAVETTDHGEAGRVTISIGVSTYEGGLTLDEFVRRADEALYAAKNGGRNRIECYGQGRLKAEARHPGEDGP